MTSSITGLGPLSGITFSGLASGLDTQAIIQALLAVEQRPITALQVKRQSYVSQKSLFTDLEQRLQALQDAADDIRNATGYLEYKAAVADPTIFTATATSSATAGTYEIDVQNLARAQVSHSLTRTSNSTQIIAGGTGAKLTLQVGTQTPVDVDLPNALYSLDEIAAAINAEGAGVTASVLQAGTNDYKLIVTGQVGAANAFTVTATSSADLTTLASELTLNQPRTAEDAQLTINGLALTRSTNQIGDAITGVTLDLLQELASSTLTVSTDTTKTGDKVQAFVDAYNRVLDFMEAQSAIDPTTNKPTSPLFGDSTLRSIRTTLRGLAGASVPTGNLAYELLSQVGIDSDRNGRLTFDRGEFDTAVTTDEKAVRSLFTANPAKVAGQPWPAGIAVLVWDQTESYLDTVDGILVARQKGYDDRIRQTDQAIEAAQRRLAQMQASLTQKFSNLEVLLNRLQTQGSALGGIGSPFQSQSR